MTYEIETTLDLGDLGVQPATVLGTVNGHGDSSTESVIRVTIHMHGFSIPIQVKNHLSQHALGALQDELRSHYEAHGGKYQEPA